MYCYTVFQCFTRPSQLSLECTTTVTRIKRTMLHPVWSLKRYEHTRQSVSYKDWSWTAKIHFIDQQRCEERYLLPLEPTCALYPQKVTIKVALENKRLKKKKSVQCNMQDFDCQSVQENHSHSCLWDGFLYLSEWVISNRNSVYGRLLRYIFTLNRWKLLSIFLHIHSPALLHYLFVVFLLICLDFLPCMWVNWLTLTTYVHGNVVKFLEHVLTVIYVTFFFFFNLLCFGKKWRMFS